MQHVDKEKRAARTLLWSLALVSVAGIGLASEAMGRFGLAGNYVYVVSLGLLFSLLLQGRRPLLVLCVLTGVLAVNLPESILGYFMIDRDFLLASVCSLILVPTLYDLLLA